MRRVLPGLLVVAIVTAVAWPAGQLFTLLGGPVIAVAIGVALSGRLRAPSRAPGIRLASKRFLLVAIVLLGALLSLQEVGRVGLESLPVLLSSFLAAMVAALVFARVLRVPFVLASLIAAGTAICGASAIAAVTPVLEPDDDELAYALATIFAFNITAVLAYPALGRALGLSQHGFGLLAGTAINDTSSVVAAATVYGTTALGLAVVVKLARVLLIVPVTVGLALVVERRRTRTHEGDGPRRRALRWSIVPIFLYLFLLAGAANSLGLVPEGSHDMIRSIASVFTTAALAAVGLSTNVAALRARGVVPLLYGGLIGLTVAATCLLVQHFT
jgi:uncharacterized integral membrane protein (TIGR00698 family)